MLGLNEWDEPYGTPSPLIRPGPNIRGTDRVGGRNYSNSSIRPSTIGELLGTVERDVAKEGMILGTLVLNLKTGKFYTTSHKDEARVIVTNLAYLIKRATEITATKNLEAQNIRNAQSRSDYAWLHSGPVIKED